MFDTDKKDAAFNMPLLDVPVLSQWPDFPTGCESVSAVMLLGYHGYDVDVTSFVKNHLPKNSVFYKEKGKRFGPDPFEFFVGDPKKRNAYGCMAPVIEKALISCMKCENRVRNLTGAEFDMLCRDHIDWGRPVLVWVTIGMMESYPGNDWYLKDGSHFYWPANEHCMVLIGYDDQHYYFNDPYEGKKTAYEKEICTLRYNTLGKQALTVV